MMLSRHWKISTGRHYWKWPPQYLTNSTLFDFNEISYVGRLWCPELIPDIAKFLPVSIFKMATTILQKIKLRICHNAKCSFKPVVSGRFGRLHNHILLLLLFSSFLSFRGTLTCPRHNLSTADLRNYWTEFHETWWSYRYMFQVGPKVFSFVVKGVKVIFWGVQRGWGLL
jgi:hypothetical protein